jgi:ubiquinone/menaquinone biosynthesis C-methylase UbiE
MSHPVQAMNERAAARAFNKQASLFDDLYSRDSIIQYKRKRVRDHIIQWLQPNSNILELNAGTGDDAIFFAKLGHSVHATDISPGMQKVLTEKVKQYDLRNSITSELCSYTDLDKLVGRGPYDLIFSNFAGLNCTSRLPEVLRSFDEVLKPGGLVTLIILPKFCIWEFLLIFKGKFKTALRRFTGRRGAKAHIEGEYFRCWYYNPTFIQKHLKDNFERIGLEGLCTIVPPSYLRGFAQKYPKTYQWLAKKENKWKTKWPWKTIGDYYIITFRKKNAGTNTINLI